MELADKSWFIQSDDFFHSIILIAAITIQVIVADFIIFEKLQKKLVLAGNAGISAPFPVKKVSVEKKKEYNKLLSIYCY